MIYYIYKVRRKQTSIRSSRSALPRRYLRYISWISWIRRPQAAALYKLGFLPVLHSVPHPARLPATGSRIKLRPYLRLHLENKQTSFDLFSKKKKNILLLFFRVPLARRSSCVALPRVPRVPPSAAGPPSASHVAFCGLPINKKCGPTALRHEPAHHVCQTCSKKRRLLAQEKHTQARPAFTLLLRPCCFSTSTARIHYCPFSFLKGKEKRKQKQIQQVRIHRSDSLRSSSRCTRLARRASSAKIYVAIATRFVRDCVEDLAPLAASMERIPKCSWHIKDHCLGVIKASRTSSHLCVFFLPQNLSPKKFDFSQKI